MKEDAHARIPKVNEIKKSPKISPSKLFIHDTYTLEKLLNINASKKLNQTGNNNVQILDSEKATYKYYMNEY